MRSAAKGALWPDLFQGFRLHFLLSVVGVFLCLVLDNGEFLRNSIHNPYADPYAEGSILCVLYFYFNAVSMGGVFSAYVIPILAAVPYAASYALEAENRMVIYKAVRAGNRSYFRSKILVSALTGGACTALGSLLFMGALSTYFPITTPAMLHSAQAFPYHQLLKLGFPWVLIYLSFLSGSLWAVTGMCISAFLPSPYLAMCFPMIFQFLLVEAGRLLGIPSEYRLDLLLNGRSGLGSDSGTLLFLTILTVGAVILSGILFRKQCERSLQNAF